MSKNCLTLSHSNVHINNNKKKKENSLEQHQKNLLSFVNHKYPEKIGLSSIEVEECGLYHKRSYLERYEKIKKNKIKSNLTKRKHLPPSNDNSSAREKVPYRNSPQKSSSLKNSPRKLNSFTFKGSETLESAKKSSQKKKKRCVSNNSVSKNSNDNIMGYLFKDCLIRRQKNEKFRSNFGNNHTQNYSQFFNVKSLLKPKEPETELRNNEYQEAVLKNASPQKNSVKMSSNSNSDENQQNQIEINVNSNFSFENFVDSEQAKEINETKQLESITKLKNLKEIEIDLDKVLPIKTEESEDPLETIKSIGLQKNNNSGDNFSISTKSNKGFNTADEMIINDLIANFKSQLDLIDKYPKFPSDICKVLTHMNNQAQYFINHLLEGSNCNSDIVLKYRYQIMIKNIVILRLNIDEYIGKSNAKNSKSRNGPTMDVSNFKNLLNENMSIINEIVNDNKNK